MLPYTDSEIHGQIGWNMSDTENMQDAHHSSQDFAGKYIVMLGTDQRTRGGIAAVIRTYDIGGLFRKYPVRHIFTHEDGGPFRKMWRYFSAFFLVLKDLINRDVAAVHAHVSSGASFWRKSLLFAIARMFGVPTIFHLHSGAFRSWLDADRVGLRRWWALYTLRRSTRILVLTISWRDWMRSLVPQADVLILGNPIVLPAAPVDDTLRGSCSGSGRVLYLGWIYDFKGVYDLLAAWVEFSKEFPNWRLIMAGKGEIGRLLNEAERLGVRSSLDFLGWIEGDEKELELRRADVLVLPSYAEGMPVSVLEGMAYGAAIATTPVGGIPDIMEPEREGLWMTPGDVGTMSACLARLARSPELRQRLASSAALRVRRDNGVHEVLDKLWKIYKETAH